MSDPATQEWHLALGESTSARLRHVEAERDELTRLLLDARQDIVQLGLVIDNLLKERDAARHAKGTEPCAYRGLAEDLLRERGAS